MTMIRPLVEKSLLELLGLSKADFGTSAIGLKVAAVSNVPIKDLSDWHLAFLLRQRVGAAYLLPLALQRLEKNIWYDAGLYPGDLVYAAIRNRGQLTSRPDLEDALQVLLERARSGLYDLDEIDRRAVVASFAGEGIVLQATGDLPDDKAEG